MPVVTMLSRETTFRNALSATLRDLCGFVASTAQVQMSEEECDALARAAAGGEPEAEFTVGSVFDAANQPARAKEWYLRSAAREYLPAMLALCALR